MKKFTVFCFCTGLVHVHPCSATWTKTFLKKIGKIYVGSVTSTWMSVCRWEGICTASLNFRLPNFVIVLHMVYSVSKSTFHLPISKLYSSNARDWPYFLSSKSEESSQESPSESSLTAIMMYGCRFQQYALSCTDRWRIVSSQKFCKMSPILTGGTVGKTTNHICSLKEVISSASDRMNETDLRMGEEQ